MTQKHHIPSKLESFLPIAGAAFGFSVLFMFALSGFVNMIYHNAGQHHKLSQLASIDNHGKKATTKFVVPSTKRPEHGKTAGGKTTASKTSKNKPAATASLSQLLKHANAKKGAKVARKCLSCHSFKKGDKNKVGPNLYGILGQKIATVPGFKYSTAMKKYAKTKGHWKYDNLGAYLQKPKKIVPKTKMAFTGIRKKKDLIDLMAYLRSNADKPVPLPIY